MNYPVWEVTFGAGLLIAWVSVLHVFVSHFAVGGGLFLVLTERKAYRENDDALLAWLQKHTRFFALVTVVFGAISGVGIWFTIGLIQPAGTGTLIRVFVWGWAIEWVFFFLEITAVLLYMYGWDRVDRKTHLWLGWIYFGAAYASLAVINGIICFMLTPGGWIQNHAFWSGFLNPTYFPSLLFRTLIALALAGIYALITTATAKDPDFRARIARWSTRWIIPAFVLMPLAAWWYVNRVPEMAWVQTSGWMPTATRYSVFIVIGSMVTFLLTVLVAFRPRRISFVLSSVILVFAFFTMWSFEFIREAIRKPYIISGYMYGNSLFASPMPGDGGFTVEHLTEVGALKAAKWVKNRDVTEKNVLSAGADLFRIECKSCHTLSHYRAVETYIRDRGWDSQTLGTMLPALDLMHNGAMPPFAGTTAEQVALTRFIAAHSALPDDAAATRDGETAFHRYCGACHRPEPQDAAIVVIGALDRDTAIEALGDLSLIFDRMPKLPMSPSERGALYEWIRARLTEP